LLHVEVVVGSSSSSSRSDLVVVVVVVVVNYNTHTILQEAGQMLVFRKESNKILQVDREGMTKLATLFTQRDEGVHSNTILQKHDTLSNTIQQLSTSLTNP
ncbi:hypothetical protein DPMN_181085, partial [Dreissena polymorpha]